MEHRQYIYRIDLINSWTNGDWSLLNDTIFFEPILIYDTVSINNTDSLVLSFNYKSERISEEDYATGFLSTGGQNQYELSARKLYYKRKRLYVILENGKLDKVKRQGGITSEKFNTWFIKQK